MNNEQLFNKDILLINYDENNEYHKIKNYKNDKSLNNIINNFFDNIIKENPRLIIVTTQNLEGSTFQDILETKLIDKYKLILKNNINKALRILSVLSGKKCNILNMRIYCDISKNNNGRLINSYNIINNNEISIKSYNIESRRNVVTSIINFESNNEKYKLIISNRCFFNSNSNNTFNSSNKNNLIYITTPKYINNVTKDNKIMMIQLIRNNNQINIIQGDNLQQPILNENLEKYNKSEENIITMNREENIIKKNYIIKNQFCFNTIKTYFRKLSRKVHPNKGGDEKDFKKISNLYQDAEYLNNIFTSNNDQIKQILKKNTNLKKFYNYINIIFEIIENNKEIHLEIIKNNKDIHLNKFKNISIKYCSLLFNFIKEIIDKFLNNYIKLNNFDKNEFQSKYNSFYNNPEYKLFL